MIKEQLTLTVSNNQLELVISRVLIDADGTFSYYRWGDIDYLKPFKQTVEGKKLDLTNVKTIYFAPKCSIPRDKAKPFLEEKKIKTVRDRATADVIIAGIESVESGIRKDHLYYVERGDIIPFINGFVRGVDKQLLTEIINNFTGSKVIIDKALVEPFYINNHSNPTNIKHHTNYGSRLTGVSFNNGSLQSSWISTITDDYFLDAKNFSNVYSQEVFNNLIGDTVIDRDAFDSLRTMLKSMDKDNHLVAMTIMAGCNYEKSFVYLALLLEEFGGNTIYNQKYRTSVAFKSLLNWLGYNKYRWDKDAILNVSIEKGLLTQELLNTIKASILDESRTFSNNYEVVDVRLIAEVQVKVDKILNKQDDRFPSGGELLQEEVSL
jgi:hypothetical protein